jgi:hypothetical protein
MVMTAGGEPHPFDWAALVPRVIHPMRVQVVEALRWIGEPLSASDLTKVFDDRYELSFISYHVVELAKLKAIKIVRKREVRGATEKFYFFP